MRLLFMALVLAGLYLYVYKPYQTEQAAAALANRPASRHGFVPIPEASGVSRRQVTVFAALNCPKEAGQRADRLAESLRDQGIPVQRLQHVSFSFHDMTDKDEFDARVAELNKVMNGELPIVMINGRARANPPLDEVIAEYRDME